MRTDWLLLISILLLAFSAAASGADPVAPTSARPVIVDRVHDGDSIHGSIDLGYGITFAPKGGIRAYGYDCWELGHQREQVIGKITEAEIAKGIKARDDLIELLKTCDLYAEDSGETDPHGRGSSILWAKPRDGKRWIYLARWMREHGHIREP